MMTPVTTHSAAQPNKYKDPRGEEDSIEKIKDRVQILEYENQLLKTYWQMNSSAVSNNAEKDNSQPCIPIDNNNTKMQQINVHRTLQIARPIAIQMIGKLNSELIETRVASEKLIDSLSFMLEETEMKIADLQRDAFDFKKEVVVVGSDQKQALVVGRTVAELVVRYLEGKMNERDSILEKLRIKNGTLKSKRQKLEAQLKQKDESGNSFHSIDYHKLQIENKRFMKDIGEKNRDLTTLKIAAGRLSKELNKLQNRLRDIKKERDAQSKAVDVRKKQLQRLENDINKIESEINIGRRSLELMCVQKEEKSGEVNNEPELMDYVQQKAEIYDLRDEIKIWERKVEIAEMKANQQARQQH